MSFDGQRGGLASLCIRGAFGVGTTTGLCSLLALAHDAFHSALTSGHVAPACGRLMSLDLSGVERVTDEVVARAAPAFANVPCLSLCMTSITTTALRWLATGTGVEVGA